MGIFSFKEFLRNEGINGIGLVDYMHRHDVKRKLQNNPQLCELTVDKLKKELEN